MRQAEIYLYGRLAGLLTEDENGYTFQYDAGYLADDPVRLSSISRCSRKSFSTGTCFHSSTG